MNEIKAFKKLRQWAKSLHSVEKITDDKMFAFLSTDAIEHVNNLADEIEAEIATNYMRLPVDADGIPIRVGDEMTCHGDVFKVCAVAPAKIHRWVTVKLGEPQTTYSYDPAECTHYKPRTLEDVLNDRINDVLRVMTSGIPIALETALNDSFGEECADEIRELLLDGDE